MSIDFTSFALGATFGALVIIGLMIVVVLLAKFIDRREY